MTLPGVDEELQKILDANMSKVDARRRAREAIKDIQLGIDHILFKVWFCLWFCCGIHEISLTNLPFALICLFL